jgi:hypothetical protein
LFSITNNLSSGSIFSVNDVSGIPSIDVDADGTIQLAPYGSTEYVGIGTTNPTAKLDVRGSVNVSGGNLSLGYDDELRLGGGSELKIEHRTNGDSTITESGSGALYLGSSAVYIADGYTSDLMARFNDGGSVELYHNHIKKFETASGGISVTGDVSLTSELNFSGPANKYVDFYTKDSGGTAYSATLRLVNHDSTSFNFAVNMIRDGAVELYHSGTKKFETTSGGVTVTGTVTADGLSLGDNEYAYFGAGNDLQIYSDGTHGIINSGSGGDLKLQASDDVLIQVAGTENAIVCNGNGAVDIRYDNVSKLQTTGYGVTIAGGLNVSGVSTFQDNVFLRDGVELVFGNGNDLRIFHDTANSIIDDVGQGSLVLR